MKHIFGPEKNYCQMYLQITIIIIRAHCFSNRCICCLKNSSGCCSKNSFTNSLRPTKKGNLLRHLSMVLKCKNRQTINQNCSTLISSNKTKISKEAFTWYHSALGQYSTLCCQNSERKSTVKRRLKVIIFNRMKKYKMS